MPLPVHVRAGRASQNWFASAPLKSIYLPSFVLLLFVVLAFIGGVLLSTAWAAAFMALLLLGGGGAVAHVSARERGIAHYVLSLPLLLFALISFIAFLGHACNAAVAWKGYAADAALSAVVALVTLAVAVCLLLALLVGGSPDGIASATAVPAGESPKPAARARRSHACGVCCSAVLLALALLLSGFAAWHACLKAAHPATPLAATSTAPGLLVADAGPPVSPAVHLLCEGSNASLPTGWFSLGKTPLPGRGSIHEPRTKRPGLDPELGEAANAPPARPTDRPTSAWPAPRLAWPAPR